MKDYSQSYAKAVATNKQKYGDNTYRLRGMNSPTRGQTFKDPEKARMAGYKKNHPTWFDEEGNLKEQFRIILANKAKEDSHE